jgi:hypothetical protein
MYAIITAFFFARSIASLIGVNLIGLDQLSCSWSLVIWAYCRFFFWNYSPVLPVGTAGESNNEVIKQLFKDSAQKAGAIM